MKIFVSKFSDGAPHDFHSKKCEVKGCDRDYSIVNGSCVLKLCEDHNNEYWNSCIEFMVVRMMLLLSILYVVNVNRSHTTLF
jgi:hypothetical protein